MNRIFPSSSGTNVSGDMMKKAKQHIKTGKKFINKKVIPSATKNYKSYVAPTVGLFKGAASIATGVGKLALRNPKIALATGLLATAKKKTLKRPMSKEWTNKGKWMV